MTWYDNHMTREIIREVVTALVACLQEQTALTRERRERERGLVPMTPRRPGGEGGGR